MTLNDGFERTVSDWLDEQAGHGMPGYLDEALARTTRTRQRPAWSSLERWFPVQSTLRFAQVPRIAWLLVVLGLIVSLAAAALWIGTRHRLPNPFGPARNGAIVMSHDGDIYALDPLTHAERLIVGGEGLDFSPIFSRDGTKLLFLRGSGGDAQGLSLEVAEPDGTGIRDVTPTVQGLDWFDWSPDGSQIVFLSRKTAQGPGLINVVNVDGSGLITLDVGRSAHFVSWLPPLGREIVFRGEQNTTAQPPAGIWAVHPDGTGLRELTRPATDPNDYLMPAVAQDGSKVSYTSVVPAAQVHILDLRTGLDAVLPSPDGITDQSGSAYFSPDGRFVGYVRSYPDKTFQFVVAPVDGSGTGTPVGPRLPDPRGDVNWSFTPDGSAVIVDYGNDGTVQLLPIDGSPGSLLGKGDLSFADIQRLAP
jgi:hypothetical protein